MIGEANLLFNACGECILIKPWRVGQPYLSWPLWFLLTYNKSWQVHIAVNEEKNIRLLLQDCGECLSIEPWKVGQPNCSWTLPFVVIYNKGGQIHTAVKAESTIRLYYYYYMTVVNVYWWNHESLANPAHSGPFGSCWLTVKVDMFTYCKFSEI